MRDNGSHRKIRGNAPHEHGARCGRRTAGIHAAGASPERDYSSCFRTKRVCIKHGAKHTAEVGGTTTVDAENDEVYAATICCCTTAKSPRL